MLTRLEDLSEAGWILNGRVPLPREAFPPVRVGNCVPPVFEAWRKVLHPIFREAEIDGHLMRGPRVRWEELAREQGLEFHPEIHDASLACAFPGGRWPRLLRAPREGTLDAETCMSLVEIIEAHTSSERCYFYYTGVSVNYSDKEGFARQLYRGLLRDVLEFEVMGAVNATPEYWWPEDRAWCVHTDWDTAFTLIGGPEAAIEEVGRHPELESLLLEATSRVDFEADQINARPVGNQHAKGLNGWPH
jgi:hypothetical protein